MPDDEAPLPAPGQNSSLLIQGPAGRIEALLAAPAQPARPAGFAVICHPHPLFGGAMTNKVAYTLAACALKAGLYALRFNFRGVGRSEGQHDHGKGETSDTLFLVEWLRRQMPADARLALLGFSFGAHVGLLAAVQAWPFLQVSVAPTLGKYGEVPPRPDCPWLVVQGSADEVVDYAGTQRVLKKYSPLPELVTLDGAGHFFHGRLGELQDAVLPFIARHWTA